MSTNFYATIQLVGDDTTPEMQIHLGKTSGSSTSVDGNMFASFADMVAFLKFNEARATIKSESGVTYTLEELELRFYDSTKEQRTFQHRWMQANTNTVSTSSVWLDDDSFSMCTGSWS